MANRSKKKKIKNPHLQKSIIKQAAERKLEESVQALADDDCFLLSMKHLDQNQGDTLYDWQASGILAHAIEVLSNYCKGSLKSQVDKKKFTIYGDFPPSDKTEFTHPDHVPEDAEWARIHTTGVRCLIGHIVSNTFYLVFLDAEHKFWISEKRNT